MNPKEKDLLPSFHNSDGDDGGGDRGGDDGSGGDRGGDSGGDHDDHSGDGDRHGDGEMVVVVMVVRLTQPPLAHLALGPLKRM